MNNAVIYLKDIGLSDFEIQIYLNLLKNGPSTVLEISRRTGINRITVHTNSQTLIKKGQVSVVKKGKRRFLLPENPERLESLIKFQEEEVKRRQTLFPDLIKILKQEASGNVLQSKFEVRTYEGKVAISNLYDEILQSKEIRAFVNPEEINRIYPENFKKFAAATNIRDTKVWDIVENNGIGNLQVKTNTSPNYKIKVLPEGVEIGSMDYLIHDNKITIIEGDLEPVAVVISSKALYENSKAIFDCMWMLL